MSHRLLLISFLLVTLNACTTEAWYEGVRQGGEQACRKQPAGAAEECLGRINRQTYDQYDKARQGQ